MESPLPLVSIIVPIYKVEPYLRRCLDSIVNQTYTNLEIILVDDDSPDGCPAICDEYAAKDNRVVVIHKDNGGLSDARNAGLNISKGDFISFVDSDDWIANSFIEVLLRSLQNNNADLSICSYIKTSSSFCNQIKVEYVQESLLSSIDATKKLWSKDETAFVTAWGKISKRELWNNIRFPKGMIHEDEYTSYKLLYSASKTVFIDIPLYFYFQRIDSIMAGSSLSSIRVLKARWERFEYFKTKQQPELIQLCLPSLCWDLLFAYSLSKRQKKLPVDLENSRDLLLKFRKSVKELNRYKFNFFHIFFLKLFSKIPQIYLLYRKLFPIHIRDI